MGMYTEFHFNAELKKSTPNEVITALRYMSGERIKDCEIDLQHGLFQTKDWECMLHLDSYSFPFRSHSFVFLDPSAEAYWLNIRSSFRNTDNEIQLFLDWILPFANEDEDDLLGFYRYEENREPTLIYGLVGGWDYND